VETAIKQTTQAGWLAQLVHQPWPIAPLVTFRWLFGLMMVVSTARFVWLGWIDDHFVRPRLHFHYYGFGWVEVLPPGWMYALHGLMLLAALGLMLGAAYRFSAVVFFLTFTYTELIDITYYLNHYYFVSVVALLLIFLPANRGASLDVRWGWVRPARYVSAWVINLLKFQIAIVYVFAGLAKLRYDWLINALPLKIWLPAHNTLPVLGTLLAHPLAPWVFSWGGMLFDTFIVLLLIWPRSRPVAYALVVIFHLLTGLLFQIGVFPLVMIASTPLFFSVRWHGQVVARLEQITATKQPSETQLQSWQPAVSWPIIRPVLLLFVVFQLLFPWRYVVYPGNLFWTEQGYRFGWRVMLMEKAGTATFYVKDRQTGREGVVDNREFLNDHQEKQMAMQPDLIVQFAHFLARHYNANGVAKPSVRAEVYVTLNGRPSRLLIDPTLDLTTVQDGWAHKTWILPNEP
jgi:hypothetical protein